MPLGLAIGMFVVLVSVVGFIHYAVATPGPQTHTFLWGLANGVALYAITPKLPIVGPWLVTIVEMVVNPPIPRPDWLSEDMVGWVLPAAIVLVAWLYVSRILRFRPKFSLGSGASTGGGGKPQQQHQQVR